MKKKVLIGLISFCSVLLIVFVTLGVNYFLFVPKSIEVDYNDDFPNVSIYSHDGKEVNLANIKKEYKFVFYLSSSCSGCLYKLPEIKQILDVFSSEQTQFMLVWEDKIPLKKVNRYKIDINDNYSLNNKVSLSGSKPTVFLIDKQNKITFISYEFETLINKLFTMSKKEELVKRGVDTLQKDLKLNFNDSNGAQQKKLVFFSTEGCESCKIYYKKVFDLAKEKNMQIFKYSDLEQNDGETYTDYENIYKRVFDISSYPTYMLIDSDGHFNKFTEFIEVDAALK